MKRRILLTILLMVSSQITYSMTQEEQDLLEAMRLSEESLKEEQARILAPGIYDMDINGISVRQLALNEEDRQTENITCGPRSMVIADALNRLIKGNKSITPESMHQELQKIGYAKRTGAATCTKQLEAEEFEGYMNKHKISLPSFFALGSQGNEVVPLSTRGPVETLEHNIETTAVVSTQLNRLAKYLGEVGLKSIYFICSDARAQHWFLISVVKMNNQITLWYIDPKNVDLKKYAYAHKFIGYVQDQLVDPAMIAALGTQIDAPRKQEIKRCTNNRCSCSHRTVKGSGLKTHQKR